MQKQVELPKEEKPVDPVEAERVRIASSLFNAMPKLSADYKNLIKHTGGLLTQSMTYAYTRALQDALKLILKGETHEKPI